MKIRIAILVLVCLAAVSLRAQTQFDRISTTSIANRQIVTLSGTTPSVALGNVFQTASNGTITNFTNGDVTQQIQVICADTSTAIADSANIVTSTGGTLNCAVNTVYSFIFYQGGIWVQSGTSSGGGGGGGSTSPGLPNHSVQSDQSGVFTGDSHFLWTPNSGLAVTGGSGFTHSLATGAGNLNALSLGPSAVSLSSGQSSSALNFLSTGNTQFTVGSANPFRLPTASGAAGTVLMSNGANPQVTSWSNNFTNGLQATLGTLTTDVNPFNLTATFNNAAQVFNGVKWIITNTAYGAGSFDYQFCAGTTGTACFTVDPLGRVASANQVGSGDGSAAGNLQMLQGAQPTILANNAGIGAPTSVDVGGAFGILPGTPCSGILSSFILSAPIYQLRCSNSAQNKQSSSTLQATVTNATLCSTANCPQGDYEIKVHADSNQTCSSVGSAALALTITFTDDAGTKTNQTIPWSVNGSATLTTSMALGDLTHNASGTYLINSSGASAITYTATVTNCTTGTAQASYKIEAVRF